MFRIRFGHSDAVALCCVALGSVATALAAEPARSWVRVRDVLALEALPSQTQAVQLDDFPGVSLAPLSKLPALRALEVAGCEWMEQGELAGLASLSSLTELDLGECDELGDPVLEALARLGKLERLSMDASGPATPSALGTLAKLPALRALTLGEIGLATGEGWMRRLSGLSSLRELSLDFAHGPSDADLTELSQAPLRLDRLSLKLGQSSLTAAGFETLSRLPALREIESFLGSLGESGLDVLARLDNLDTLRIYVSPSGDPRLKSLSRLKNLTYLWLTNNGSVTDADLAALAGLPRLEGIELANLRLTDAGVAHLAKIRSLSFLDCTGCRLTDAALAALSGLPALTRLEVAPAQGFDGITDAGLAHLARIKTLRSLTVGSRKITDQGLGQLAALPDLEDLVIRFMSVTDTGLAHLAKLGNLKSLTLGGGGGLTDAGLAHLARLKKLETLDLYDGPGITDAGIQMLSSNASLQSLRVSDSQLTVAGARTFRKALPGCYVDEEGLKPAPASSDSLNAPVSAVKDLLCEGRRPCRITHDRDAGRDAQGHDLRVVEIGLFGNQIDAEGDVKERHDPCLPYEEHVVVTSGDKILSTSALVEFCNDGYGAWGGGEDSIVVRPNRFEYTQTGGSGERWGQTREIQLSPRKLLTVASEALNVHDYSSSSSLWSWEAFGGLEEWANPRPCAGEDEPGEETDEGVPVHTFVPIPQVSLDDAFVEDGWKTTALGTCSVNVDGAPRASGTSAPVPQPEPASETLAERGALGHGFVVHGTPGDPRDSRFRALLAGDRQLFVEVHDDRFVAGSSSWLYDDHLELWLGERHESENGARCVKPGAKPQQWGIRVTDGKVFPAFGKPAARALQVEVQAVPAGTAGSSGSIRLRIVLPEPVQLITLAYSDSDDGQRQKRLIATSDLTFGSLATLGEPGEPIPNTGCAVGKGVLDFLVPTEADAAIVFE